MGDSCVYQRLSLMRCCRHADGRCLDGDAPCSECDTEGYPLDARRRLKRTADGMVEDVDDGQRFRVKRTKTGLERLAPVFDDNIVWATSSALKAVNLILSCIATYEGQYEVWNCATDTGMTEAAWIECNYRATSVIPFKCHTCGVISKTQACCINRITSGCCTSMSMEQLRQCLAKRRVPNGTWSVKENHKIAFDILAQHCGGDVDARNFYSVSQKTIRQLGLSGLIQLHYSSNVLNVNRDKIDTTSGCIFAFIRHHLPCDVELLPWLFASVTQNYWDEKSNHKLAYEYVRKRIGANENVENWYNVSDQMIKVEMKLAGLIGSHYNGSYFNFLQYFMPDDEWKHLHIWCFSSPPKGYWNNIEHSKHALNAIRQRVGADTDVQNWYLVNVHILRELRLCSIISSRFGGLQSFLENTMPENEWKQLLPWRFGRVPRNFWISFVNRQRAFEYLRTHVKADMDVKRFYMVNTVYIFNLGILCGQLYHYYDSVVHFLQTHMDSGEWSQLNVKNFGNIPAQETWLIEAVEEHNDFVLLGADCIHKKSVNLGEGRTALRIDVVALHVPTSKVCVFEADGEQHFGMSNGFQMDDWDVVHARDKRKLELIRDGVLPLCTDGRPISHLFRISFRHRFGCNMCKELVQHANDHCTGTMLAFFSTLQQDTDVYDIDGLPLRLL